jgi:hypothetical protein
MFWEPLNESKKPSPPKYEHRHEVIVADENEYQAKNFLSEMPQLNWVIEKTFGGKNKYIIQSDSKPHIDFFLHMMKEYVYKKNELNRKIEFYANNDKTILYANNLDKEECQGSLEHIRFKHMDGNWYGDVY